MGIIIGIDVGGSTTKIVGLNGGEILSPLFITAADPITSLFGAFGKYIYDNGFTLSDIEHVMLTGVGSSGVTTPIYGLPTSKADEFQADGLGARYDSGLTRLTVVSMGTGTTFVRVDGDKIWHIGGLGLGGGTLQGLAHVLLKTDNFSEILELAEHGNIEHINLQIKDISTTDLEGLPLHATASLFGKVKHNTPSDADLALGIICMVLETIGSGAVLSKMGTDFKDFVLIGNLTRLPQCAVVFPKIEEIYGVRFHIPAHAEFCTALGAALAYREKSLAING